MRHLLILHRGPNAHFQDLPIKIHPQKAIVGGGRADLKLAVGASIGRVRERLLCQLPVLLFTAAPVSLEVVVLEVSEGGAPGHPRAVHLSARVVLRVIVDEGKLTILVKRSLALMICTSDT